MSAAVLGRVRAVRPSRLISVEAAVDGTLDAVNKRPCNPDGRFDRWHWRRGENDRPEYVDAYRRAYAREATRAASPRIES